MDEVTQRALGTWAAACAERVLSLFATVAPDDPRPAEAVAAARAWLAGEMEAWDCREAAGRAHDAAAAQDDPAARAAARSAAHAAGVAHMARHAGSAASYALRAVRAAGGEIDAERAWQQAHRPPGT